MYQRTLAEISEWLKANALQVQPPATETEVQHLRTRARQELGFEIPEEYCTLLRRTNGFDFNGLAVYACRTIPIAGHSDRFIEGFVEANLAWRAANDEADFVAFAESGLSLYVFRPGSSSYAILDRASASRPRPVASFEELFLQALEVHRPSE